MSDQPSPPLSAGVNLICHATGTFGLAVAAKNTLRTLDEAYIDVAVIDVDAGGGRSGQDSTYADRVRESAPHAVNLFHLNPPEIVRLIQERPDWLDLENKVNACVPFWELPKAPPSWVELLEAMDVVLAPTRFVFDAIAAVSRADVVHYPQTVYLPEGVQPDRERFGIPADVPAFMLAFDFTSDVARKNPYASLQALRDSGLSAEDVRLVMKLTNSRYSRSIEKAAEELKQSVADDARVIVLDESLAYSEMLSLTASCDALISLHRSEGLGLNLLEAMSLGKPVVSTGWSGSMDFTTHENSCLVPYALVPVSATHPAYQPKVIGEGQVWAEPDVKQASRCLERLATDAEYREGLGARALSDMERLREDPQRWMPIVRLIEGASAIVASPAHGERVKRLHALRHIPLATRARRLASATLRKLGVRR